MGQQTQKQYEILKQLAVLELKDIGARVEKNHHAEFKYDDNVVEMLIAQWIKTGVNIDQAINAAKNSILVDIAKKILNNMVQKKPIRAITISSGKNSQQFNCIIT